MQNELISPETEQRILHDLHKLIDSKKAGKLLLKEYLDPRKAGACTDFAMLYESSDALQALVRKAMQHGVGIAVGEDRIEVL